MFRMLSITCVYLKTLSRTTGDNPRSTILVDIEGKNCVVNLWTPWDEIADYIKPLTKLKLFNVEERGDGDSSVYYSAGSNSIVVVDPDILINATSLSSVSFCPRSHYLNQIIGDTLSPLVAVKGTIVHNSLSSAVIGNSIPSEVLPSIIDSFLLYIERFNLSKDEIYQDVYRMVENLDEFVDSLDTTDAISELLFLSPSFGIRGRIDLFIKDHIYELKTAKKTQDDNIRFSDLMQVVVYSYGKKNDIDEDLSLGSVIYVGKELVKKGVLPNWNVLRYAIEMRNLAYRIEYLGYVPPILTNEKQNKCNKCSMRFYCSMVCSGLKQQRTCDTCPHNLFCTKKELEQSYKDYFLRFSNLLRLEKNEWARNMSDLWTLSVKQRVEKGKCISGLVLESEIHENGKTQLLFSCKNESELREGDIVLLSDGDVLNDSITSGVITRITNNSVEVETRGYPQSVSVIDIYSIDIAFRRQQRGLFNLIFKQNNFVDYIVKSKAPLITMVGGQFITNNETQNEAIKKILGAEGYCLIQGPAGTGKTHIIAKAAIALVNAGKKVLLSAFTNRAVDNMCKYLISNNFTSFVRLGDDYSTSREILPFTLRAHYENDPSSGLYKVLSNMPVVVATTSTISNPIYENLSFDVVIMDEASQMTEPMALAALLEGKSFVLVGDHKQLPPVVQSMEAQKEGLSVSLFERLATEHPEAIHLLTDQFRMNEKLMEFSNRQFYGSKLRAFNEKVRNQNLAELKNYSKAYVNFQHSEIYDPKYPLVYIMVTGTFEPQKKINVDEAKIVAEIANNFLKNGVSVAQLGIIAPYRGQVAEIRRLVPKNVTVDTIDRFQGSDREIIVLSVAESAIRTKKGFGDPRRLNVAITRAKKKLVVVANPNLGRNGVLGAYLQYLETSAKVIALIKSTHPIEVYDKVIIVSDTLSKTARFIPKLDAELIENEEKAVCLICYMPVKENGVQCPFCERIFHLRHLVQWLKNSQRCPYCKTKLEVVYEANND